MIAPDDPRQGTIAGYDVEIRLGLPTCDLCRHAKMRYEKARLLGLTGNKVSALGSQRRVRALRAAGWNLSQIATEGGWKHAAALKYPMTATTITRRTHERIRALYERLEAKNPPTASANRARTWARRFGCEHTPSDWFGIDMDDPDAEPYRPEPRPVGRTETLTATLEDFDWLIANGEAPEEAAARVGVTLKTITRYRLRADEREAS